MIRRTVRLARIDDVKTLVNAAMELPCDVELVSGKYVVDAKSIMGIFSLDLNNDLELCLNTDQADDFLNKIAHLLV